MKRLLLLIPFYIVTAVFANTSTIDKKIQNNQEILKKNRQINQKTQQKIKSFSNQINEQTQELKKIESKIKVLNNIISKQKGKLHATQEDLVELKQKANALQNQKKEAENQLVDIVIDNFSWAFAINLASKKSLEELIDSELYTTLSKNSQEEIQKLNNEYLRINQTQQKNEKQIDKLKTFIAIETKRKENLNKLQKKQQKTIASLQNKHNEYQQELKKVVKKQKNLSNLLSELNILKQKEIKKEQERQRKLALEKKRREQQQKQQAAKKQKQAVVQTTQEDFANNIDIEVRMLGSSTKGIKIGKYRGVKTIPPLKSYQITKKFGKYFDPVYKIQLFNESIVLKSNEQQAKVFNVLNGKVVYAKQNSGMLENVVIIQHDNGLHTIYSHLEQISPTIKVGKWIKKGYVVGRVSDSLTFQATKNSTHINPQDLFN
jgi:murein DD-endopeptidase MepM/ murein hydrolase activator NlpD